MVDPIGVQNRHYMGVETLQWSSDYPHRGNDWPNSMKVIESLFAGVPEDERYLMAAGNCVREYKLA